MHIQHPILSLLAVTHIASAQLTSCNANDCLRQVRASAFPARPTRSDCSAFQTPAASPATIPAYASSCRNSAAYSSACNCIGIPASTGTPGAVSPSNFGLLINYGPTPNPARYLTPFFINSASVGALLKPQGTTVDAVRLALTSSNGVRVVSPSTVAGYELSDSPNAASFVDVTPVGTVGTAPLVCSIAQSDSQFTCAFGTGTGVFAVCTLPVGQQSVTTLVIATDQAAIVTATAQSGGSCGIVTLTATV